MKLVGFVFLALFAAPAFADKCRVLAFEGGGSRGAYQAGVVYALSNSLPAEETAWTVISGVSTGALNTAGCIQFPVGQEREMSQFLVDTWLSLNGSATTYIEWTFGLVDGLLFKPSLYDSSPLRAFLASHWLYGIHRNFTIPTTDFNRGSVRVFDESIDPALVPEAVMCSAAPPFYFPPQHFEDTIYVDGGCLVNLDLFSPINKCLDFGYEQSDIVVDMIFLTSTFLPVANETKWTPRSVSHRVKAIRTYDSLMWFGYYAKQAFPWVDFRYTFVPSVQMPGGEIPLDFERLNLIDEIELGKSDAMKIVNKKNGLSPLVNSRKTTVTAFAR